MVSIYRLNSNLTKRKFIMKKILALLFIGFCMISCQDWLDINVDPNRPGNNDITVEEVLPQVELSLAVSYGGVLHNQGSFFVQYFDQAVGASNFKSYTKYEILPTNSTRVYNDVYSLCLVNAEAVRKMASESEDWGNYLAATTLKVFAFQALVDCYGETPYSEALLGADNSKPKYDQGEDVYNGILTELNEALDKSKGYNVTDKNLLFGANSTNKWRQFAKALKLKLLMRQANVNESQVKNQIMSLITENDLPTTDVKFSCWVNETGKSSPWYEDAAIFLNKSNHMGAYAYISTMLNSNDPRLDSKFDKSEANNNHKGGIPGYEYNTTSDPKKNFSSPIFDPVAPVYMITTMELDFWKAEAEYRWGSKATAKTYYEKAIDSSFAMYNLENSSDIYAPGASYEWVEANGLKLIALQKWISLACINGFESWCEVRRLGYPEFSAALGSEIYTNNTLYTPGTLISPVAVSTEVGPKQMLNRLYYAQSSIDRNPNTPKPVNPTTKIFWQQ